MSAVSGDLFYGMEARLDVDVVVEGRRVEDGVGQSKEVLRR